MNVNSVKLDENYLVKFGSVLESDLIPISNNFVRSCWSASTMLYVMLASHIEIGDGK